MNILSWCNSCLKCERERICGFYKILHSIENKILERMCTPGISCDGKKNMLNWKGKGISFSGGGEEGKNLTGLYVGQAKNYMLQVARRIPSGSNDGTLMLVQL